MPSDVNRLLRGLGKLAAVVVVAGLAGAGAGTVLARLAGSETPQAYVALSTATSISEQRTRRQPIPVESRLFTIVQVEVLSAWLGQRSTVDGRARVTVRVRLTNGGARSMTIDAPALTADTADIAATTGSSVVMRSPVATVAPGASTSKLLRFTIPATMAQQLSAVPRARLRIARRTVVLKLASSAAL